MNRNEFIEKYHEFAEYAFALAEKARREGLLSLEDEDILEPERVRARDIFAYGLSFVIDGTDSEIIRKILSNIIAQDSDEYSRLFKTIQKEAALLIQAGVHPRIFSAVLNSYTDLPLSEDKMYKDGFDVLRS